VDGIADVAQLEELRVDIKTQIELGAHLQFWHALMVVCEDEIASLKLRNSTSSSLDASKNSDSSASVCIPKS
jgi:hypothetical protein